MKKKTYDFRFKIGMILSINYILFMYFHSIMLYRIRYTQFIVGKILVTTPIN